MHMCSSPIAQTQVVNLPDWALGPTVITVDLSYTNSTQVRRRNGMGIHAFSGTCYTVLAFTTVMGYILLDTTLKCVITNTYV